MNRDELAKLIFMTMMKRAEELKPGSADDSGWDDANDGAAIGREVFRAAADAVLAHFAPAVPA